MPVIEVLTVPVAVKVDVMPAALTASRFWPLVRLKDVPGAAV